MISPPRTLPVTLAWSFPSRSSSSKRRLQRSCSCSRVFKERYQGPFVLGTRSCDNRRLRSRESPSPKQVGVAFKGFPLSIANGFASRGSPSPSGWDSPQGVPPLYSEWDSLQGGPLLQVNGIHLKGFPPLFSEWDSLHVGPLLQRMGFASWRSPLSRGSPSPSEWDSPQGLPPSLQRMGFASCGSPSPANGIRLMEVPPIQGVPFSK